MVSLGSATHGLSAQDLSRRIAEMRNGTVRFEYAAMEGVCGNGRDGIQVRRAKGAGRIVTNMSVGQKEWETDCESGPVRIVLDRRNGRVVDVRAYVGGRWRGSADLDLGSVSPVAASDYLLGLAETADEEVANGVAAAPWHRERCASPARGAELRGVLGESGGRRGSDQRTPRDRR